MAENRSGTAIPDLWLFDFDRTLALLEPEVDWAQSRRELEIELRTTNVPVALLDELIAAIPRGNLPLYEALRARLLDAPAASLSPAGTAEARAILARASAVIERYELAGVGRAVPMPGAQVLLRALGARNRTCAVVTSNSSRTVARWLADQQATALVSVIVGRDSGLALKPSPAMVQLALELCTCRDAIFVGDSEADLRAAHSASLRFLGIAPELSQRARLLSCGANEHEMFQSPAELTRVFDLE